MLIGHKSQWEFLTNSFKEDRLPQALMFTGEQRLGKKKTIVEFSKFINCKKENKPCGKCENCKEIEKGSFSDFNLVKPDKGQIKIGQVRDVQKSLSLKSQKSPIKIAVFDEAEKLNRNAQNCLLKTLEEPRGKTLIVLVTSKPKTFLSTINSRCEVLKFYPVKLEEYKEEFSSKDNEKLKKAFALSFGKPGKVVDLLKKDNLKKEVKRIKKVEKIIKLSVPKRISFVNKLSKKDKKNITNFINILENFLRMGFIDKMEIESNINKYISFTFPEWEIEDFKKSLEKTNRIKVLLDNTNSSPQLSLEELMLSIPKG